MIIFLTALLLAHTIGAGVLRGRSFGGVAALIEDSLRLFTVAVVSEDRFCVIKIGDLLLCNVICLVFEHLLDA